MINGIFDSLLGNSLYKRAKSTIEKHSMQDLISKGVLVGFSGGKDSVFLLNFLVEYREREKLDFPILAVHVNHSIRGEEALRDQRESESYARNLGVEFKCITVDAPAFSKEKGIGLEEAARILRYSAFQDLICGRNDISTVAVAHNSTDNLETILFNMMRGAGTKGLSGISPVRDNIIRPLIEISKNEIVSLLSEKRIPFVVDSTNFSLEYTRNYIRNEVLPKLAALSDNPEKSAIRLSENLRCDNSFIEDYAKKFLEENLKDGKISTQSLISLHEAPFARVIAIWAKNFGVSAEKVHIDAVRKLLPTGNFKQNFPSGLSFVSEFGCAYFEFSNEIEKFSYQLKLGENYFEDFDDIIVVSEEKLDNSFSNVYKISIQAKLDFDIINEELLVRSKNDGDSYRFGGMNRKVKKLFIDKKIPESKRVDIPVFVSGDEVLWVAGFKPRDYVRDKFIYVSVCERIDKTQDGKRKFFVYSKI